MQEHVPSSWQYAGVAVREFWHVDEKTIIFVADPSLGMWLSWILSEIKTWLNFSFEFAATLQNIIFFLSSLAPYR